LQASHSASPHATGDLFDLPHVVAEATQSERLAVQGGDFFKNASPNCDAYLILDVIRNWGDVASPQLPAPRPSLRKKHLAYCHLNESRFRTGNLHPMSSRPCWAHPMHGSGEVGSNQLDNQSSRPVIGDVSRLCLCALAHTIEK